LEKKVLGRKKQNQTVAGEGGKNFDMSLTMSAMAMTHEGFRIKKNELGVKSDLILEKKKHRVRGETKKKKTKKKNMENVHVSSK